ncbi:isoprenylcysteine carboxyl methyltransferase family protein [Ferviditalea candida]|uniref:Isoprenylcysteine carboxylmethyltransferase family protein n=1 Tax=Ferviditalea candida TaxID=3108399 RepID=A0ABU5ZG69_9BACL|nr:isoprenylcysteine carboxylmethyltransferase family protein [Paenibacillaceae bacterium T2]
MLGFFFMITGIVVLQRAVELLIAKRNGERIKAQGGYETGADHYKYFVGLHSLFFLGMTAEVLWRNALGRTLADWWLLPFGLFVCAQALRVWCMSALGAFWNTRIFVVPGMEPVRKGPYRYFRHPNYLVVTIELAMLPLVFQAYFTASVVTVLNALLLKKRISVEEQALVEAVKPTMGVHHETD